MASKIEELHAAIKAEALAEFIRHPEKASLKFFGLSIGQMAACRDYVMRRNNLTPNELYDLTPEQITKLP
jgi:hypothetical protein